MRFRQVHLDFHTSEAIPNIGSKFSKEQFQAALTAGNVDSITVFSKCHHGWAYHPSTVNEIHPGLSFDLLGDQIAAAHEIGVNTPVYLSAGLDEKEARRHPEWLIRNHDDRTDWVDTFLKPGYHQFCFNTPYLDILIAQVEEVVRNYNGDGIFLDIVSERVCYCHSCLAMLKDRGVDPENLGDVVELGRHIYVNYTSKINAAIQAIRPGHPVFHNGGHIVRGKRDLASMDTHLELESLPTGGWGYDHFPLSAGYARGLGLDYLGMTGKFHTSWGEFGGFKHPNALRYETALALANGARSSVGDQLSPTGEMDMATYSLIGRAYTEVEAKEQWSVGARNIADVALLSLEAVGISENGTEPLKPAVVDAGAVRILLEGKLLFDVIDCESNFSAYKVIILPDDIIISPALKGLLSAFLSAGGKLLATGRSGLNKSGDCFQLDFGARWLEPNKFLPDYFHPRFKLKSLGDASFVFYGCGQRIKLEGGTELGYREDPYFNRTAAHFCSHQHTPSSGKYGGPGMVEGPDGIYVAWAVFDDYATKGSLILKEAVLYALDRLLGASKTLTTDLPAQGVVTLAKQATESRFICHLLYASPVRRGNGVEVIEDIVPISNVHLSLRLPEEVKSVTLEPQGTPLQFDMEDGRMNVVVPTMECHQMVVFGY